MKIFSEVSSCLRLNFYFNNNIQFLLSNVIYKLVFFFFYHIFKFSEYKVQGKIGEGSFSEVLKCQDKNSGVCIAAKHLKKCFKR